MKTASLFTCLFLILSKLVFAQTPAVQWQNCLGSSGYDAGYSIRQTLDGGYIIAAISSDSIDGDVGNNNGRSDFWIIKLNSNYTIQWQKNFGGSQDDMPFSIEQTSDRGYVIAGSTASNDGDVTNLKGTIDFWVIKLDSLGNFQWQKTYGGSDAEEARYIQQTSDNGFIVAGLTTSLDGDVVGLHDVGFSWSDYWVIKLDSIGSLVWAKALGGYYEDYAYCVKQTQDQGYLIVGASQSVDGDVTGNHGNADYWIVKLDSSGNLKWEKSLGGTGYDEARGITETINKSLLITGYSYSIDVDVVGNHGLSDFWTVKLDSYGNVIWTKTYGGSGYDYADGIEGTVDGGYILVGSSGSSDGDVSENNGGSDAWMVKLDSLGNLEWEKVIGGTNGDIVHSVNQTTEGGYIIVGETGSNDIDISGNHGFFDVLVIKLDNTGSTVDINSGVKIETYPNPASEKIIVKCNLYDQEIGISIRDAIGKEVINSTMLGNEKQLVVSNLCAGFYTIILRSKDFLSVKKIIIER